RKDDAKAGPFMPGTAGFVGEVAILLGSHRGGVPLWAVAVVGTTVIFGAWYLLRMLQAVVYGRGGGDDLRGFPTGLEAVAVVPLLALSILIGCWATPLTTAAERSLQGLVPVAAQDAPAAADIGVQERQP
ncbi:MAG: hypothetical protein ACOCXJ_04150, partial [Planctomycetota bacterium]